MRTEEEIRKEIRSVLKKLEGNPYDPHPRELNPLAMRWYVRGLKWILNDKGEK